MDVFTAAEKGQVPCRSDAPSIPPAMYTRLSSASAGQCWLCGLNGKHASQVVTDTDSLLFSEFQRRGIIQLPDLTVLENLVFLCSACNNAFNDPINAWIMVPTSLDTLIAAEKAFQVRRMSLAAKGEILPRTPGPAAGTSMLYSRYQIRPRYLFTHVFTDNPTRPWPGSPLAAIIRSARIVAGLERLPVDQGGMPIEVAMQLQHLMLLLGTPDLQPAELLQAASGTVGLDNPDSQIVVHVPQGPTRPGGANQNPHQSPPRNPSEGIPGAYAEDNHDLSFIGRSFNSALKYIHDRSTEHNMSAEAYAWIKTEIRMFMLGLQKNLRHLYDNKDNPVLLPEYAINRAVPMNMYSSRIPYALAQYQTQFQDLIVRLMTACDFKVTCVPIPRGISSFLIKIEFPRGGAQNENSTIGNRVFDSAFEDEFLSAIDALTFEPK